MTRRELPVITNCDDCGACCLDQAALPLGWYFGVVRDMETTKLPPEIIAELQIFKKKFDDEGWPKDGTPCIWYDAATKKCRHYEHRPEPCVEALKPGDDACRKWRKRKGIDQPVRSYFIKNGLLKGWPKRGKRR